MALRKIAVLETKQDLLKYLRYSETLHMHLVRYFGSNAGKAYMRWVLVTEPKSIVCERSPERCAKISLNTKPEVRSGRDL